MHPPSNSFAATLTPEILLAAYARGIFPMAESASSSELFWLDPKKRGVIPLDHFHISKSLRKTLKRKAFRIQIDHDFTGVITGCAARSSTRDGTWINDEIIDLYHALFRAGYCHTVEIWDENSLVGGLYGVALGGAFFGESMFHRVANASKIALCHLVRRLVAGNFTLLDTQFVTSHLRSLGAIEISRARYHRKLRRALQTDADFYRLDGGGTLEDCLQSNSQIS